MKVAIFLLCLLPLVFTAPSEVDKRFIFDLHHVIDQIKHLVTPDMEQGACETLCKSVVAGLGSLVCGTACSTLISSLNG
ncbi:uncharacterized protein LOC133172132 [Saccostrea echinata]|uniref:uncharacterized protein LOC133172132 n=1 Tax=Saccostrea echinata TaxID=191078 RepID=UPI002A8065A4|nr:uncharacterized protein LOC133172132 [Saccostrea echinata]